MFTIFKKARNYDLKWLGVDMHNHLIPGIDDGCPNAEASLECITGLQELGLHTFYCTPHIYSEIHPNSPETILPAYERLKGALAAAGKETVRTAPAAEYMLDDAFTGYYADGKELLTLPGRQVLIEMSYQFESRDVQEQIFQLQLQDYQPVLAHPERYNYYHASPKTYARLKERGCLFQLNILSLSGYYGEPVRKMAQHLVKENMIDYIGTDLHHTRHLRAIRQFLQVRDLQKLLQGNSIRNPGLA